MHRGAATSLGSVTRLGADGATLSVPFAARSFPSQIRYICDVYEANKSVRHCLSASNFNRYLFKLFCFGVDAIYFTAMAAGC